MGDLRSDDVNLMNETNHMDSTVCPNEQKDFLIYKPNIQ